MAPRLIHHSCLHSKLNVIGVQYPEALLRGCTINYLAASCRGILFLRTVGSERPSACSPPQGTERGSPTPSALSHSSPQQSCGEFCVSIKLESAAADSYSKIKAPVPPRVIPRPLRGGDRRGGLFYSQRNSASRHSPWMVRLQCFQAIETLRYFDYPQ